MKKLLNTLYITNPNRYLSLDGENIVLLENNKECARITLHNLESIITYGYAGASPALMGACVDRNINLCFLNPQGNFLARVSGKTKGNVVLRKSQYLLSDQGEACLNISKNFIIGKIYNARGCIERTIRDYELRVDVEHMKKVSGLLKNSLNSILDCQDMERLRGLEGEAASLYFSVFDQMILQQKDHFYFQHRNKRPPLDNINALLSFVYTLLANMCNTALETVGLDPYVGFMHCIRPGRASLALDLMEEFRAVLADRFVLSLVNKRMVHSKGFKTKENGAVVMNDETKKVVLTAWQNRKMEIIKHPFLNEKVEWGMAPFAQAMLLARFVRGDLDEYPPFLYRM